VNIVVCIKQILDPEIRPRDFQVDSNSRKAIQGTAALVVNPNDENAVEVALQLKTKVGEATVTAITLGAATADKALRRVLGMGCDEGIWLRDPLFEDLDSAGIARVLATGIKKLGNVDLVLCGLQAGDWDMGQVGYLLAEELSLPCVSAVYNLEPKDGRLVINRGIEKGTEILEGKVPLLAIVTNHNSNLPRYPSAKRAIMAGRRQLPVWTAAELGIEENIGRQVTIEGLSVPSYDRQVEIMNGDNGQEKSIKLVQRMIELKLI